MTVDELFVILTMDKPSKYLSSKLDDLFLLIPELGKCKDFDQHNTEWHLDDVLTHIFKVVDDVPNNLPTRLAALFHDVGKPYSFTQDENGVGHFYGHWDKSRAIFLDFAIKNNINSNLKELVEKLILYHDKNFGKSSDEEIIRFTEIFSEEEMHMLYRIKRADLLSQNPKHHDLINDYNKQIIRFFKFYDLANKKLKEDFKHIILGTGSIYNVETGNKVYVSKHNEAYTRLIPDDKDLLAYKELLMNLLIDNNQIMSYLEKKDLIQEEFVKTYYKSKLQNLNLRHTLDELYNRYGDNIILVTDELIDLANYRRIIADYFEMLTDIYVPEIITKGDEIIRVNPVRYKQTLGRIMKKK